MSKLLTPRPFRMLRMLESICRKAIFSNGWKKELWCNKRRQQIVSTEHTPNKQKQISGFMDGYVRSAAEAVTKYYEWHVIESRVFVSSHSGSSIAAATPACFSLWVSGSSKTIDICPITSQVELYVSVPKLVCWRASSRREEMRSSSLISRRRAWMSIV